MKNGHGRCYAYLSSCDDKEKYRKILLYGCLHGLNWDEQCEGTRAEYVYRLCSLLSDEEYFLKPAIEKFKATPADGDDFNHLCDLIYAFAQGGKENAQAALREKYKELYAVLLGPRGEEWYDYPRDGFERLAIHLTEIFGLPEFLAVAKDIGNLYTVNDHYCGWDFDCFYADFAETYGKEKLDKVLESEGKSSPEINKFFVCKQEEEARQLEMQKKWLEKQEQSNEQPRRRRVFSLSEKQVLRLIKKLELPYVDKFKRHAAVRDIINAFDNGLDLPRRATELIYEKSFCSCCRYEAVKLMSERGWLTDEIKKECAFDCDELTAELVAKAE